MNIIHSNEYNHLPENEQYFYLAQGFLEGSKELCEAIIKGNYTSNFSSASVILHLYRQAIELFLKGAIVSATKENINSHQLDNLYDKYNLEYPDPEFYFELPFRSEPVVTRDNDLSQDKIDKINKINEKIERTLDQRYKYPTDVKGNSFSRPEAFEPTLFMRDVGIFLTRISEIESKIKERIK